MAQDNGPALSGPDLRSGVEFGRLVPNEPLLGHFDGAPVILVRQGEHVFATGAVCTHYGGPLAEGLVVGDTVRCPWHHARFSLETGEAVGAPAFNPMPCWRVERRDGMVFVRDKVMPGGRRGKAAGGKPDRIVIVGGGAAGFAAAEMLRREGFSGEVTLLSADEDAPYDRPNCSKDYLAGNAPQDWMPLRPP